MSSFLRSTAGRLITLAVSLALLGGGASAVVGGVTGLALLSLGILTGIALSIVGVALGIEDDTGPVILYVLMGPWVLFLYGIATMVAYYYQPSAGYLLLALGAAGLARGLFSGDKVAASQQSEHSHHEGAPAH